MARPPRPTDPVKLKAWAKAGWPREPQRQKSEYDAGMVAINAAEKSRQQNSEWEAKYRPVAAPKGRRKK